MRFSCIRDKEDRDSFRFFQEIGMNVYELEDLERTDEAISRLIKDNYTTIFLSNEVAGFSEDIIKKYQSNSDVNIIIAPSKRI